MIFIIITIVLSLAGCSNSDDSGNDEVDWTRGIYCEVTQEFLRLGMTRDEVEQILGEGEVVDQQEESYIILYQGGNLRVVCHEDRATMIEILGEGFLVFGLSYGSSVQEMLDTLGEPCMVFYGRDRVSGDEDLYGYDNLDDFNMGITFIVDSEEGYVISIVAHERL